jgi:acetoin utilization deacetylase AcuC-like enzyme
MSLSSKNDNSSRSPEKPKELLGFLCKNNLLNYFFIDDSFKPFEKEDFYIAHHKAYVDSFFSDDLEKRYKRLLGLSWSKELADTTIYTNASLYNSILASIKNPEQVCFSPTSVFHHAFPKKGALYCPFSGQVIASVKIYRELGLSGCYIDLDGHYGNSINNSYDFVDDLDKAIPPEIGNINIDAQHQEYLIGLEQKLKVLEKWIMEDKIQYLVFCHGADSHEWDDLGYQLSTEEWIKCSEIFYTFVLNLQQKMKRQIPLCLSLFGGYRKDDYDSVLSLHTADLVQCLNILCGRNIPYVPRITPKRINKI